MRWRRASARKTTSRHSSAPCGRWATTTASRGTRSGGSGRCWSRRAGSPPASACSTSPPARATWPSAPPRPARRSSRSTSRPRTSRRAGARRAPAGSSSSGSRPTPSRCRSATVSSTSSRRRVGAIFAPDHQAVADELVRVCRPGGTIGMINFTPEGLAGEFFALFGRHAPPPPPGAPPPVLWGSEAHVRELFGDRLASLELTRRRYVERSPGGPSRLLRLLQADVRARGRALREPRRTSPTASRRSIGTS